jgi:hypothetical protein
MAEQRSRLSPRYAWVPTAHRFRDTRTGKYVPEAVVRAAVDATLQRAEREMQRTTARLAARTLTVDEWQARMAAELKVVHLVPTAAARGGWNQMSPADYGWVGSQVKAQLRFLRGFADDLRTGKQLLNGTLPVRVALYANAGRHTYEAMRLRLDRQRGLSEESNALGRADHCRDGAGRSGCIEVTRMGWRPIGTLPLPGERHCLHRCHCTIRRR